VLSPSEVETLIAKSPARTALLIRFLGDTGVRISEALNIKLIDCRADNGRTKIRIFGKGKKERTVRISTELFTVIQQTYGGVVWMFESRSGKQVHDRNVAKEILRLGQTHLGRHVTPHMFRHTFATNTIKRTGKRKAVSVYLGHSSTAITEDMYNSETLDDTDLCIVSPSL
jgi:integrase/recombinase XerD